MDFAIAKGRYTFLADALDGTGGFAPHVEWTVETLTDGSERRRPTRAPACHLIPYTRESAEKFAGRCALAVYENHLRSACERFTGFLGRRRPMRTDADAPLVDLFIQDCDMRGTSLDAFFNAFALQAKARGAMLLLIDEPAGDLPRSQAEQIAARRIPYLRAIPPEAIDTYALDNATGAFSQVTIFATEVVDGKVLQVKRRWDAANWYVLNGDDVIASGAHKFGACPVIAFTESGQVFPHVGRYAQVADISRRLFNLRSELDELLRSQTFSLLTLQLPAEQMATFGAVKKDVLATIGTHSLLMHGGVQPAFISPDSGPAATYLSVIDQLQMAVRRITMEDSTADSASAQESGVARRMRFEAMNADLAGFAQQMQQLESRMWAMFGRATGSASSVKTEWPSDFNLVDTLAELDILAAMQATAFPPLVLAEKRKAIAGAEFDAADADIKFAVMKALDEQAQEPAVTVAPTGSEE